MHHLPSILPYRPKTSPAAAAAVASGSVHDAASATAADLPQAQDRPMKRTASQTFSTHHHDFREHAMALDAVEESELPAHTSSLSRALGAVTGSFTRQKTRRRLSSFSSTHSLSRRRRSSIQGFMDSMPATAAALKPGSEAQRAPLQHQDSGIPITLHAQPSSTASASSSSKPWSFKKLGTNMRRRSTVASYLDGEDSYHYPPLPAGSVLLPGAAARQSAAAANDRQRREQEHTTRFLAGQVPAVVSRDGELQDNESGVDMTCASPMVCTNDAVDPKMVDPFERLPAELATAVLSNLDAQSLASAERVSRCWRVHASSTHVWRTVFLRQFEPEVHVNPNPIQMGGAGIGKLLNGQPAPAQKWKSMYQARATMNRRWKSGTPAAIYLNGHTDSVYCCQFDENKCITGSRDRTIRVWDMKTFKCRKVYGGPAHRPMLNTPASLDERPECVVSHASLNGTHAGNTIYHIPSDYHDASILCLQYDDTIMVTGSSDHTCIVWDITGDVYKPKHRLCGHEAGVLDVCLDAKYIISCSKDAMIKVWDRKTGQCVRTLRGHRGPVNAVQLRGNFLVSASGDGIAKLWNLDTGVSVKDFPSEDRGLAAVEFSDDAKYLLAGGNDHVVYKFDASTGNLMHSRVKHDGLVRSLFLDAFNGRIVSGSYDQSIQVSDYQTGQTYATYKNWTTSWILSAKSDYRRVVATSQDGRTLILDFGHEVKGAKMLIG